MKGWRLTMTMIWCFETFSYAHMWHISYSFLRWGHLPSQLIGELFCDNLYMKKNSYLDLILPWSFFTSWRSSHNSSRVTWGNNNLIISIYRLLGNGFRFWETLFVCKGSPGGIVIWWFRSQTFRQRVSVLGNPVCVYKGQRKKVIDLWYIPQLFVKNYHFTFASIRSRSL